MYIRAKYPKIGHEDYSMGVQGFGSLYGGNHQSNITQIERLDVIVEDHADESLFGDESNSIITNI